MDKVVEIRDINPHIVCSLCAGYFIDATTITECLHTFCRRCIVKYLQVSKYCPTCNLKVHETQPLVSLRLDRTMQDIVFKVVPNLLEDEEAKEKAFYEERGIPVPKKQTEDSDSEEEVSPTMNDLTEYRNSYKDDELVSLCLRPYSSLDNTMGDLPHLPRQYVRCSHRALVSHLEKLMRKKLNIPNDGQLQLLCNDEVVDPLSSMKFLWISHWRRKEAPMNLYYRTSSGLSPFKDQTQDEGSVCLTEDTFL